MTIVEFFGDERSGHATAAGRWDIHVFRTDEVVVNFLDFSHPAYLRGGEIRLYVNADLDEYFEKPAK
jgi:hypothetical protein